MIFLLITAFIGIVLFEVPDLLRKKYWRELAFFSVFLFLGFILSLLQNIGVKLPDPNKGIQYFFKEILNLYYR